MMQNIAKNSIGYLPTSMPLQQICQQAKASEIRWKHVDKYYKTVLRMGTFHTTCSLISIIGKRFHNARLRDLLIETGITADGSIFSVLEDRMYNRGVSIHKLMYESLEISMARLYNWN